VAIIAGELMPHPKPKTLPQPTQPATRPIPFPTLDAAVWKEAIGRGI
jgi:hypothetical protein